MYMRTLIILIISLMNFLKSFQYQYQITTQLRIHNKMALFSNTINSYYKRPSLDDIERISKGQAAKSRGVGSRQVPHRLNTAERKEWDLAKVRRYLQLRGTGWRKERGDSPLANIYRNYCDSVCVPSISIIRAIGIDQNIDEVVIDFSPLRITNITSLIEVCIEESKKYGSLETISKLETFESLGWNDSIEEMFNECQIWRIPSLPITLSFHNRNEAKEYAESIAILIANGKKYSRDDENENIKRYKSNNNDYDNDD